MQDSTPSGSPPFDAHPRSFAANCYVYPVLSRFERDGLVTARRVASSGGPARKYYAITERGDAARLDAIARWRAMTHIAERGIDPEGAPA